MPTTNGTQMARILSSPIDYPDVADVGGRVRVFNERITLAAQPANDIIRVGYLPKGARLLYGYLASSVSLGAATVRLGSAAADAKYRAAATLTTADVPVLFGVTAGIGESLTDEETVILTIGTAALPANGTLRVVLFYSID